MPGRDTRSRGAADREVGRRRPAPTPVAATRRARGDEGQILLLSLAYGLLALLLVGVVVSATAVHLQRKELLALADMAALEAADALDDRAYYAGGSEDLVVLTPATVRGAVDGYLRRAAEAGRFRGLRVVEATTADGRTARVTLQAVATVPLLSPVTEAWGDGVPLRVTSAARTG